MPPPPNGLDSGVCCSAPSMAKCRKKICEWWNIIEQEKPTSQKLCVFCSTSARINAAFVFFRKKWCMLPLQRHLRVGGHVHGWQVCEVCGLWERMYSIVCMFCLFQCLIFLKEHHGIYISQSTTWQISLYKFNISLYLFYTPYEQYGMCIVGGFRLKLIVFNLERSILQKIIRRSCMCPWGMWVFDLPDGNVVQDLQAS